MTQLSKITYISNAGVLIESGDKYDKWIDSSSPFWKGKEYPNEWDRY